jgi:hypothetical protein
MITKLRPPQVSVMARVMIIVARDRPELFDYFRESFAGIDQVEVIMDRRLPDGDAPTPPLGDQPGRRWQPDVYDELTLQGFVIKRLQ